MNEWIFKNTGSRLECTSFPFAFRTMWAIYQHEIKAGKSTDLVTRGMSIESPHKDSLGNKRIYCFESAVQMAKNQGLLSSDGQINSREFKKKF